MKSYFTRKEDVKKTWYLVDAKDRVLGRLAAFIAKLLTGKGKPVFSWDVDCGDFVVVINAKDIKLTGKKLKQKYNFHYSGYPGGDKYVRYDKLMKENPEKALVHAVKGMLAPNRFRAKRLTHLKIYKDAAHTHAAQNLTVLEMK